MKNKSNRYSRIFRVAGIILSACLFVVSWVSIFVEIPQIKDWRYGLIIGFILFAGFMSWQFHEMSSELDSYRKRRPHIEVTDIIIGKWNMTEYYRENNPDNRLVAGTATVSMSYLPAVRQLYGSTEGLSSESDEYNIVLVTYKNQRLPDQEIDTAFSVSAHMSFFDSDLNPLLSNNIDGRWADLQEPTYYWLNPQPKHFYLEIDIPANGERKLCVAAKQKKDDKCYVYNLDTYQENKVKRAEVALPKGKILVQIILQGSNFDNVSRWFELHNPGRGKDMEFKPIKDITKSGEKLPNTARP